MDRLKPMIKEWVKTDDEIGELRKRIRLLTQSKKTVSAQLLTIMKEQKIDEFDLNSEGKLVRQTKKTKAIHVYVAANTRVSSDAPDYFRPAAHRTCRR
jgi:hypothetical protein